MSWMPLLLQNTQQRNGKCTDDRSAFTGRAIPRVISCHLYPSAQPPLSVLSLPDQKAKMVWSYTEKGQSVNSHPSSPVHQWEKHWFPSTFPYQRKGWCGRHSQTEEKGGQCETMEEQGSPGYSVPATKLAFTKQWFRQSPEVQSHLRITDNS